VAFEEPELYLHPSAANLLRDTVYEIGATDQIVCTTHSPWMIDLSRSWQSLSKMILQSDGSIGALNYGVADRLENLADPDKGRVKMLQLFDDELSRVFFSERIVVIEGDTEEVVFKASLRCLPEESRRQVLARVQVVKARGKASIISLVKYLRALGIAPFVIHDRDGGKAGAEKFNAPIAAAVGAAGSLYVLEECVEDALGYPAPGADKPFVAYKFSEAWKQPGDVPPVWWAAFTQAVALAATSGEGAPSVEAELSPKAAAPTPAV
jgi:hypothetical protein